MSNGTNTVNGLSGPELTMESYPSPPSSLTCVSSYSPVQPESTEDLRTWLQQVSPASLSALPGNNWAQMMNEICGPPQLTLFEPSNPPLYSSKTFPLLSQEDTLSRSSLTCKLLAIKSYPLSGCQLVTLGLITKEKGCGLLPTPSKIDGSGFYVVTKNVAEKRIIIQKRKHKIHWMQYSILYHGWKRGWANPRFSEKMMGWPIGWTDLQPLAMDKFQQWQQQHGDY